MEKEQQSTGIIIAGIVWQIDEYVSKDGKVYYSVLLLAKPSKNPIKISLPVNFDRAKFVEGALVKTKVKVNEFKGVMSFSMVE